MTGTPAPPAANATLERVKGALGDLAFREAPSRDGLLLVEVARDDLLAVLTALRDGAGFETVTFVTAVDRMPDEPRYEVNHQLHSLAHGDRVRVKTRVGSDSPSVPSCTDLWPGVAFMERECFDMFGVVFDGNPDLRRLLMPDGYGHHPLRKDFPHQGIEPDRLYREWDRERRADWDPEA